MDNQPTDNVTRWVMREEQMLDELAQLRAFKTAVEGFVTERAGYITALQNCAPDNTADYWRWQGHAEARRLLCAELPWPPGTDVEQIKQAARITTVRPGPPNEKP